jgi:two-component system, sensor histidine kinase and response regulator
MTGDMNSTRDGKEDVDARIGAEQIRVFYTQTNTALIGNLLAILATLVLLWDRVDQDSLKIWAGIGGALVLFRLVIYRGFDPKSEDIEAIRKWGLRFTVYALLSGLCWGALPGVFFETRDPFVPIFIVCVVAGLLVGALGALSAHAPAYRAYVVAMVVPLIIRCFTSGVTDYMVIGGLVTFSLLTSLKFGMNWERTLKDQIRHRLETEALLAMAEKTRDALALSEQRLAAIIDNTPASVFLKDLEGRYLLTNRAIQQRQGFTPDQMIGITAHDHLPAAAAEQIAAHEKDVIAADETIERELEIPQPDGGSYVGLAAKFPIHDADGKITAVGTITTNITRRKNTEEALRESERRVAAILEASPIGVSVISSWSGKRIFVNQALMTQFGAESAEELTDSQVDDSWVDPGDYQYALSNSIGGEPLVNFVAPRKRLDGTVWWALHNNVELIFEGEPSRVVWHTDITQSKQAEEEVRASEARLRGLLESSPVGVAVIREQGEILFANSRYGEMLGLNPDAVLGFNAAPLYVDDDRRQEMVAELSLVGRLNDELVEHRRTDGSTFWALISGEMIDFQGERAVLSWTYDIDERVQMETILQAAKEEAEAASKAKSSFLAAMSHEIRTPMNGVLGMIEVLQQSSLSDDQRSVTGTIQESAVGLLTIIDDILDFSKIEAGRLELEVVPVNLRAILEGALDIIAPDADRKGLDLALLIDDAVPQAISGDPIRLRQVLLNLVGNAIKFTETGWINVTVSVEERHGAEDGGETGTPTLKFSVTGTGIGIPAEQQTRLFKAFSQAETSTTRRFGGTGLGLSICARLVELMGGRIGVTSTESTGSAFWFTHPLETVDIHHPSPIDDIDLSDISVLVVEPVEPVRHMITALLSSVQIEAVPVNNLAQALGLAEARAADDTHFDVLIVDGTLASDEMVTLASHFQVLPDSPSARAIRLHVGGDLQAAVSDNDADPIFQLDVSRPIHRNALLKAVAVIVGRASPDLAIIDEDGMGDASGARAPDAEAALEQGRLILVAEDNATNREVIQRQLNLLGFAAEVAEDGEIAFDMWRGRGYGMVVTDCHMPNKDGFELTQMIRDVERELGTHTPIVALTANALVGEAERCLNAGMDDYLAKPVGLKKLRQTLLRWLPDKSAQPIDLEGFVTPSSVRWTDEDARTPSTPMDLSVLAELFGDDRDGTRDMMELFLENADRLIVEIDAALKDGDPAALSRASHGLKGAANAIGVDHVGRVALEIELAGRDDDLLNIAAQRTRLGAALDEARAFIRAF